MSQPYGAAISGKSPEPNQDHRSGPNFRFLPDLPSTGNLTVTITGTPNPASASAKLYRDKSFSDEFIANLSNGATFAASLVNSGDDYYVSDPKSATEDFVVYFSL